MKKVIKWVGDIPVHVGLVCFVVAFLFFFQWNLSTEVKGRAIDAAYVNQYALVYHCKIVGYVGRDPEPVYQCDTGLWLTKNILASSEILAANLRAERTKP